MSELQLNGAAVVSMTFQSFRRGHWTADVVTDSSEVPTGPVSITDASGAVLLRGRVLRGSAPFERAELVIVGGVGALGTVLAPRYYVGAAVSTILADLARETESEIAANIDRAVIGRELAAWVRVGGHEAVTAILHLLRAALPAGWTWRTRYDGALWLGADAWPDVIAPGVEVVDRKPTSKTVHVRAATFAELLAIEPGTVFEGENVTHVRIEARSDRLRGVLVTGDRGDGADSVSDGIRKLAREATIERSLLALYEARVVAQRPSTGTVDVEPQPETSATLRIVPTMTRVPLVAPFPGGKLLYPSAAINARAVRVLVGFIDGDPSKPYALPWPNVEAATPDRIEVNAATTIALGGDAKGVARDGDSVKITIPIGGLSLPVSGGAASNPTPLEFTGTITSASPKLRTG